MASADREIVHAGLTTIANWRGYGSVEHAGVFAHRPSYVNGCTQEIPPSPNGSTTGQEAKSQVASRGSLQAAAPRGRTSQARADTAIVAYRCSSSSADVRSSSRCLTRARNCVARAPSIVR